MERRPLVIVNGLVRELPLSDTLPGSGTGVSEEEVPYSKRIDFVSETELYKGEAQVGSSESASTWRIRKITIAGDGDVQETWAGGSAEFNKIWTSRASYVYS